MNGSSDHDVDGNLPNPSFIMETEEELEGDNIGDNDQNGGRRRRVQRHTSQQIQELENFFKECPRPNADQIMDLGQRIHLEAKQVRYWFQNRRTQAKAQNVRNESLTLRLEHNRLISYQEELRQEVRNLECNNTCRPHTNSAEEEIEAQQLMAENARLKEEIDQLFSILTSPTQLPPLELNEGRPILSEVINAAMNDLITLGEANSPLWGIDTISKREFLNYEMFKSDFNNGLNNHGYVMEATRNTDFVPMTSFTIVETLIDMNKWVTMFAPIVSLVSKHEVLLTGPGESISGSLHLIETEFQVISTLVPKREVKFLRYCKELSAGIWIVVDFNPTRRDLDLQPGASSRRLPSGLIIEDMNNGYSKVTWIEQAQYNGSQRDSNNCLQILIGSGIGLSANRWLTTLKRYCESLLTLSSTNLAQISPGMSPRAALEMVKLAQRMTRSYYSGITGSELYNWEKVNEGQNISLMTRRNVIEQAGELTGIVLSASTSFWVPVNKEILFFFLSNQSFRNQWDVLATNSYMEDKITIEKTSRHENYVSLAQVIGDGTLVLQEVWNDESGALLVYAPVNNGSMEEVMRGENSDSVKLLPSGFSIVPDGDSEPNIEEDKPGAGCFLTVGFQILVCSEPTMELTQDSVNNVQDLMVRTINSIKSALNIPM